jgi:transcriptional regulator GlxA family with amidase domain
LIGRFSLNFDAMGGVDTGAWILGKAGLLDGKSATTHWEDLEDFADYFRGTNVQPDRFVIDEDVITIGGASPTFDFMLHLIRSRLGYPAALEVASVFVYDETHFSTDAQPLVSLGLLNDFEPRVTKAIRIMESNLDEPISATSIAKRLNISSRRLENLFQLHLQTTPGAYYLNLRLLRAKKYVTDTLLPMQEIAIRTGFNSLSSFSRSFKKSYHSSPSAYRQR